MLIQRDKLSKEQYNPDMAYALIHHKICQERNQSLHLDPFSIVFLGIDIQSDATFSFVLIDAQGRKLFNRFMKVSSSSLAMHIEQAIRYTVVEIKKEGYHPLACGISLPGIFNTHTLNIDVPILHQSVNIQQNLQLYANIPIIFLSSTHSLLWGEFFLQSEHTPLQGIVLQKSNTNCYLIECSGTYPKLSSERLHSCPPSSWLTHCERLYKHNHSLYVHSDFQNQTISIIHKPQYEPSTFSMGAALYCQMSLARRDFPHDTGIISNLQTLLTAH